MLRNKAEVLTCYPVQAFCIDENRSAAELESEGLWDAESVVESGALCSLLIVCVDTPEEA
jgi:hypothetical protein